MKKFFVFLIIFFLTPYLLKSEEEKKEVPVSLKADNIIYFSEMKITVARGNVRINYKDVEIYCEEVEIDREKDILMAEGKISFFQDKNKLQGDALKYDLKEEEGVIYKASGFQEPFYFTAEHIKRISRNSLVSNTTLTTCELHSPHYHIGAKEFLIYPEDKAVAKKISFWIGKEHILSFPKYVINLKEKKRQPFSPRIGYNQWDGWYIKTLYNYYLKPISFGSIYLDYMEKKGKGIGIEHTFLFTKNGEFNTYFYHLDREEGGGNFLFKTRYRQEFKNSLKLNSETSYDYQITPDFQQIKVLNTTLSISKIGKNSQSILNSNIRYIGGISDYREYKTSYQNMSNYRDSTVSLILDHLATQQKKENTNFELNTKMDFTKTTRYYMVTLTIQKRFDLDRDKYPYDRYSFLDRIPEFKGSFSVYRKGRTTPFKINTLIARYHDGGRGISHTKYQIGEEFSKIYSITRNSRLSLRNNFYQDFYSQNSAKYQTMIETNISTSHTKYIRSNFSYNYLYTKGHSPFLFDRTGKNNYLNGTLSFSFKNKCSLTTTSGYDFRTKRYQNLISKLILSPKDFYKIELNHEYDLNNHEPRDMTGEIYFRGKIYESKTNIRYDLKNKEIKNITQELNAKIGKWWKIQHKSSYNAFTKKYIYNDTLIVRDLHCWEAKFLYRKVSKEFWIELNIKAFPSEPVKIGVDETGTRYQTPFLSF